MIIDTVGEVASKHGVNRAQIALAWLWAKGVTSPVVGATKEKYLDDFVASLDVKLDDEDIHSLEEHYVPHQHHLLRY